jgi:YYY domain-containing protein
VVEAIVWWVMLEVLGLAALPLAWTVLRRLPDRGYAFAKSLGVVLVGYLMWLTAILQLSPFAAPLAWASLLGLAGVSLWLLRRNGGVLWAEIRAFFRQRLAYWLTAEVVFTLAFIALVLFRAYSPNIRVTEQYMDYGFLNSIIKNQTMPPPDHWLAGWSINYYYLGYSLVASLTLLAGVPTEIAYNLCMATLFALTALGSFGIVYNLAQGTLTPGRLRARRRRAAANVPPRRSRRDSQAAAVATDDLDEGSGDEGADAPLDVPVDEAEEAAPARARVALPPKPAISALLAGVLATILIVVIGNLVGAQEVLQQGRTAANFDYFTLPTRVIHDTDPATGYRDDYGNITEFPLFSFLLNDMHPHVMALPLMLLGLALALGLLKLGGTGAVGRQRWLPDVGLTWRTTEGRLRLAVTAIVIGMMYGLNTWDYPTFLLIVLACLAWPALAARFDPVPPNEAELEARGTWARLTAWTGSRIGWWIVQAVLLVVLSLLAYLPFQLTFKSLVGGGGAVIPDNIRSIPVFGGLAERIGAFLGINVYDKSYNWDGYIAIFGIFLFAILAFLLLATLRSVLDLLAARQSGGTGERDDRLLPLGVVAGLSVIALVGAVFFRFPLLGLLAPVVVFALYLIRERLNPDRWQPEEVFVLTLIGLGALITLTTEVFFIKDVFGRRMNTVFKFYYQTWVLWGLSAAYATWWLVGQPVVRLLRARAAELAGSGRAAVRTLADTIGLATAPLWALGMIVLVGLGLIYTAYAPGSKLQSDYGSAGPAGYPLRGLDGMAYLRESAPADYAAIQWLRENGVPGTAVAEAPGGEYNVYCYCGRVSTVSGLATVIAWRGHEDQWRGGQADAKRELDTRAADLDKIYAGTDITETRQLMEKYGVRYVFVGSIEKGETPFADGDQRHQYGAGLTKFAQFLAPVYTDGGTTIYMLPEQGDKPTLYQVEAGR